MAPVTSPETSTRARRTRCTTARTASAEAELAREPGREREVGAAIVGLVEDVEVLLVEAHAPEAVGAAGAVDALHQVRRLGAALGGDAVVAGHEVARAAVVRAVGAALRVDAVV